MLPLIFFLLIVNTIAIKSQTTCNDLKTCGQCIGNEFHCVWCSDKDHFGPRCMNGNYTQSAVGAKCKSIENPKTKPPKIKKNEPFLTSKNPKIKSVQFKPQNMAIQIRAGDTVHFSMEYKPALDYPIDIYYIMDNSYTMSFHKRALTSQAQKIYTALKKLSNNVRFGVGTFIEKPALPYADPDIGHQPDTFTNYLSLTDNITQFVDIVKAVKHSGNYDIQESGLDALMQAMVCDEVNWRREARRMIILATDAPYHSAGDGKMVGAYRPNDMKCHLKDHTYEMSSALLYDYPSISQINKIATEKEISITFAVLQTVEQEYKALADRIQGAKYVELKKSNNTNDRLDDESDLVDLIKKEYLRLLQSLEIDRGSVPSYFDLMIHPPCNKTNKCFIKTGQEFQVFLHLKKCPGNDKFKDVLKIGPFSLHERLTIEIEALCGCDCEKDGRGEKNSIDCKGATRQCGICKCNQFSYGDNCECKGNSTTELDLRKCKAMQNDTMLCSGHGECKCGKCHCSNAYEGKLCEYKTNDCPEHNGKVCGGNGNCKFNTCTCSEGWTGTDCGCTTNTSACIGANSQICSGNGYCKCGVCKCTSTKYSGDYCDSCDFCVADRCEQLGPYVECNFKGTKKEKCDKEFGVKNKRTVKFVNQTDIKDSEWDLANLCKRVLADHSSITFKYSDGNNSTLILIQREKELPPEANIWVSIGSAIGAVLLIGILTVIVWKVLVDIHDAREYKKFLEESANAGYDVSCNPLYLSPAVNIKNPAYSGNCN